MTDPWFTPEIYSILPGLIVGFAVGLYGVLLGLIINSKNIRQHFSIMTIITLIICIGVIIFGIIASVLGQPDGTLYSFVSTGLIGLVVVIGIWLGVNQTVFYKAKKKHNGNL
jgi:MFS family permease